MFLISVDDPYSSAVDRWNRTPVQHRFQFGVLLHFTFVRSTVPGTGTGNWQMYWNPEPINRHAHCTHTVSLHFLNEYGEQSTLAASCTMS